MSFMPLPHYVLRLGYLVRDNLVNTLNGYVQEVCPVSTPLKRESKVRAKVT
jgi:hypothetical protein